MCFFTRACCSIRKKWIRNLLAALLFAVLFAVSVGALVLYSSAKSQVDFLHRYVGNAVTLKSIYYSKEMYASASRYIDEDIFSAFVDSDLIADRNYAFFAQIGLPDLKMVYPEEHQKFIDAVGGNQADAFAYCPINSETDGAFVVNGYRLIAGEHFGPFTKDKMVCFLSKEMADINGVGVGDKIRIKNYYQQADKPEEPIEFTVTGIFTAPPSRNRKGQGDRPEEILFLPYEACQVLTARKEIEEYNGASSTITVFLKDADSLNQFIEETKQKLPIREVLNTPFTKGIGEAVPQELIDKTWEEAAEYLAENSGFDLQIDRAWYNMVGLPLERVVSVSGVMVICMLTAVLLVLVLVSILFLKDRKREMGILLSMGESKGRVLGQIAVEALAPILAGLILGLGLGIVAGIPMVDTLGSGVYDQSSTVVQGQNNVTYSAFEQQTKTSFDIFAASTYFNLFTRQGNEAKVFPRLTAQLDAPALFAYLMLSAVLAFIAVFIQTAFVVRLKPARILTGKG